MQKKSMIKPDNEYRQANNPFRLTKKGYELKFDYNGTKFYYLDGLLHRENAPAVLETNSYQEWWIHGKWHRLNGPAKIFPNGENQYYIDDKYYSENKYIKIISTNCFSCKKTYNSKQDLLVHYDWHEENNNPINQNIIIYLQSL